ncbi:reverse transcriptase domain-containing protein [Tanacetum coccineum]
MAAHIERIERFENAIFKQREEINDKMTEMFGLLKELTTSSAPEKVLIREDAKSPVTKNVNSISLARREEERNDKDDIAADGGINETNTEILVKEAEKENKAEDGTKNEPIRRAKNEEAAEVPSSQPTYNLSPRGPVYEAILKKKITRKEDIGGNFEIPCNIGGLKGINALVDQGSNVNVMPLFTYMKLTDERPTETDIRLSLASHSYIYPLGIAEDVLVEVAEHVYPVDFVILDIKEDEKRPFILGTQFLTTAKVVIKFDKGTITLRSGNSKVSFHRIPESLCKGEKGIKNDIEPKTPTMIVNRLVLKWEEKIKLHREGGDGVRPNGEQKTSKMNALSVIFDEKKLGSSQEVSLDDY